MYTVSIKYSGAAADATRTVMPIHPIAPEFSLGQSYVDDIKFREGIPADAFSPNIWEKGDFEMAESLDSYLGKLSEHPGVTLALKSAVLKKGQAYEISTEDYKDAMYYEDLGRKLKDDGFEITVKASQAAAGA